jgi:subtilisin family serine protease
VDYTNPILGGCFGPGCHISFGYAFVDDAYTGYETPVESADPGSSCANHGTHVTGIIGALANDLGFSGVAPAATLGHYRVLGCTGDVGEDVLVAALMRAYNDGVQIISMSIAGGVGWTDLTPSQILSEHLSSQGVHIVAAGGNEQTEGALNCPFPLLCLH